MSKPCRKRQGPSPTEPLTLGPVGDPFRFHFLRGGSEFRPRAKSSRFCPICHGAPIRTSRSLSLHKGGFFAFRAAVRDKSSVYGKIIF